MTKVAQQFSTDGFAIWLAGNQPKYRIDVHINEWVLPKKNTYLDIGIRIYETCKISNCFIYIPYKIAAEELEDLSFKLANENIARGIFNANCSIKASSDSAVFEIEYNGRKENVISLVAVQYVLKSLGKGTLIKIPLMEIVPLLTYDESYLRFRVPHKSLDTFFQTKKHSYKFQFESPVITKRYNYVIKLNEVRSLPFEVRSIFPKSKQNIQKVINTLSVDEQYLVEDSLCYKTRHLEPDLYEEYVPDIFPCSNVVVYQWCIQGKSHYNFNIKIDHSTIVWTSFLLYSVLFIIFNFVGNVLWKLLTLIPCFSCLG